MLEKLSNLCYVFVVVVFCLFVFCWCGYSSQKLTTPFNKADLNGKIDVIDRESTAGETAVGKGSAVDIRKVCGVSSGHKEDVWSQQWT